MSGAPPPGGDDGATSPKPKPPAPPKASPAGESSKTPDVVVPLAPPSLRQRYGTQALLDARPGSAFPEHLSLSPDKEKEKDAARRKRRDKQRAVTLAPEDVQTLLDIAYDAAAKPPRRKNDPVTLAPEDVEALLEASPDEPEARRDGKARKRDGGAPRSTAWSPRSLLPRTLFPNTLSLSSVVTVACLGVVAMFGLRHVTKTETPTPPEASAVAAPPVVDVDRELQEATASGEAALAALAAKYPNDARVLARYARTLADAGKHEEAVMQAKRAIDTDSAATNDKLLATVLWLGAQSKAEATAFDLLTARMGARGADILYDLATTSNVRTPTREKARAQLSNQRFAREASPATLIAAELFVARSCEVRKALLKRAANVGDARSLDLLRELRTGGLCTEGERPPCNDCLANSDELEQAVGALQARMGDGPRPRGEGP